MRRQFLLFLTLATLSSVLLLAQQPAVTGSIEGVVVRSDTGQPIAGAMVTLSGATLPIRTRGATTVIEGHPTTTRAQGTAGPLATDANGRFVFNDLKPGTYRLTATVSGFVVPRTEEKPLDVKEGDKALRNATVRLIAESILSGRVFEEKGGPAAGAVVTVFRPVYTERGKGYRFVQQAMVDDQGRYRLFGLAPGRYYLGAGTFDFPFNRQDPRVQNGSVYSIVFYPRVETLDAASPVEARLGRENSYDITVKRQAGLHSIRGRVVDAETGTPPPALESFLFSTTFTTGTSQGLAPIYNAQTGVFEIKNIPSGMFDLEFGIPAPSTTTPFGTPEQRTAWAREGASRRYAFKHVRVGDTDLDGLLFTISRVHSLPGRFLIDGQPDDVIAGIEKAGLTATLVGLDILNSAFVGAVAADGTFPVEGLREGEYSLTLSGVPDGYYVKAIQFAGEDITGKTLKYSDPMRGTLDVILRPGATQLTGTVKDAKAQPASGAQVVLITAERGRSKDVLALTDASGRFVLRNVSPGDYRLYAWDSIEEGAYYDPEFMKAYQDQGQVVRVAEGTNQNLDVKLIP